MRDFGSRALLIQIRKDNRNSEELTLLKNGLIKNLEGAILYDDLFGNPDTEQIDSATYFAKKCNADIIIAFGGLDTINTAKAVALLANNSIFASDMLNGISEPENRALPLVIVPMEPTLGEELNPGMTLVDAATGYRRYFANDSLHPVACYYDSKVCSHLTSDMAARMGGGPYLFMQLKAFWLLELIQSPIPLSLKLWIISVKICRLFIKIPEKKKMYPLFSGRQP